MSDTERRAGDPAFEGSDAITHEPIVEEERGQARDSDEPIPDRDSDEESELGENPEQQDADRPSHEDVERSTGRR